MLRQIWPCCPGLKILVVPVLSADVAANTVYPLTGILVRNLTVTVVVKNCPKAHNSFFNPLNAELNPIFYLLALLAHHFLHVSRIRVKSLTLRLLMSYIYIYIYIWSTYS